MSLELWIAFVLATSVLLIVPGSTVMLVVSYALGRGRGSAWATAPGVALGDFTAMTASLFGAGAVLATSATLFTVLKFWNAFVVTALNPKSIVFFVAFVPQFIDPTKAALPQFVILEATFLALAVATGTLWAVVAGDLRARFKRPATLRIANRVGASFLIGAGVLTAAVRRSS